MDQTGQHSPFAPHQSMKLHSHILRVQQLERTTAHSAGFRMVFTDFNMRTEQWMTHLRCRHRTHQHHFRDGAMNVCAATLTRAEGVDTKWRSAAHNAPPLQGSMRKPACAAEHGEGKKENRQGRGVSPFEYNESNYHGFHCCCWCCCPSTKQRKSICNTRAYARA